MGLILALEKDCNPRKRLGYYLHLLGHFMHDLGKISSILFGIL